MTWVLSVAGVVSIMMAMHDIFTTLWHPGGLGTISRRLFRGAWWAARRLGGGSLLGWVGPTALGATTLTWAGMIVLGFAAIYLPHIPAGFSFAAGLDPAATSRPVTALYVSLVTVATLGFGDITPVYPALRLLAPLQALMGFVLFTAAISWVLQVYPALSRRRTAARRLTLLAEHRAEAVLADGEAGIATGQLDAITEALTTLESDLRQYGETYYFRERHADSALAGALSFVPRLAAAGARSAAPEVRWAAAILHDQAHRFARYLDDEFLRTGGSFEQICERFASDHHHRPLHLPPA